MHVSEFSEQSGLYLISSFLGAAVGIPVPSSVVLNTCPVIQMINVALTGLPEQRAPARELDSCCADNLVARTPGHF